MVLGIRPDVIRASLMIKQLQTQLGDNFVFVWSGQHYSANLRDVFFSQLSVPKPDYELKADTSTEARFISGVISELSVLLEELRPAICCFLGDTNTVVGSIACASQNIPIAHIEGCMRSYDWRMPEEKYRTVIDHLADVIYSYLPSYKLQGLAEGLDTRSIVVTGNPIVDVLQHYFLSGRIRMKPDEFMEMRAKYGTIDEQFVLMTAHRRENVDTEHSLRAILELAASSASLVLFPASYRTQRNLRTFGISLPNNVKMLDPLGYVEFLELLDSSEYVLTDSGTVVEEAAVLGIPSVQMRSSTERPEVYECGGSIKFDPHSTTYRDVLSFTHERAKNLGASSWQHTLGDGQSSTRIVDDLMHRLNGKLPIRGHDPRGSGKPFERNWK